MRNDRQPRTLRVKLFRDVPEERRFSMERYADDVGRALGYRPELRVDATTVHQAPLTARLPVGPYLARYARYPLVAARKRADIFHIIDHGYADLVRRLPAHRTVITCHDLMLLRAEEGNWRFQRRRSTVTRFRWSVGHLREVARVICVSDATRQDVVRLLNVTPERTTVVHSGVDPRFRRLPPDEVKSVREELDGHGGQLVLNVSSGNPYKNPQGTLHTISLLRRRGLDVTLVCCGRPFTQEQQELARKLRLESSIIHCGLVPDARLVALYNACDALLFPSHYEGFGWPPLEAMACGLPVVTSTAPAIREVIGDASLSADADDHEGLADALASVLTSGEVAGRQQRAGLEHVKYFNWERAASEIAAVYQEVAAEAEGTD